MSGFFSSATHDKHDTVLATAVDGGRRALCIDCKPRQGLHIIPPHAVLGAATGDRVEEFSTALEPMDTTTNDWA